MGEFIYSLEHNKTCCLEQKGCHQPCWAYHGLIHSAGSGCALAPVWREHGRRSPGPGQDWLLTPVALSPSFAVIVFTGLLITAQARSINTLQPPFLNRGFFSLCIFLFIYDYNLSASVKSQRAAFLFAFVFSMCPARTRLDRAVTFT